MRILPRLLLLFFLLGESWPRVIHRSARDPAIARLHDPSRGMRWGAELVGLFEYAVLGVILRGVVASGGG